LFAIAGLVSNIIFRYLASVASFLAMPFTFMMGNNTVGNICVRNVNHLEEATVSFYALTDYTGMDRHC
jgi:hypothetical protein